MKQYLRESKKNGDRYVMHTFDNICLETKLQVTVQSLPAIDKRVMVKKIIFTKGNHLDITCTQFTNISALRLIDYY